MIFRQFFNESIAAASYLIGCTASGEAVVVDPGLPAEQYALFAADKGLRITHILETHLHADYFSSGRALAALTGARIALPRIGEVRFEHDPLEDGDCIQIGEISITALHTPGHTPEHMAYLVADTSRAEEPWFALTGDCLFVGDVGRADLVDLPLTGPEYLYRSIFGKLLALPDTTEIFPAHYGGSACGGRTMSGKVSSTIGFERRFNWALQAPDKAAFTARVSETPRAAVEAVLLHRHTNQGVVPLPPGYGHTRRSDSASHSADLVALTFQEVTTSSGATLVDLRPSRAFAAAHPRGAINVPYNRDALLQRIEAVTAPGEPLIILADQPFIARTAAALLAQAGRNPVRGYADAGFTGWQASGLPTDSLPALTLDELHQQVTDDAALVLDVREPFEWDTGVISGAQLIALGDLRTHLADVPADRPLIVICESGTRSGIAASMLRAKGFRQVANVAPDGVSEYIRRYLHYTT